MTVELQLPLPALCDVFESQRITSGMTKEAPGGALLRLLPMVGQRSGMPSDMAPVCAVLVSFGGGVAVNLFSNWLWERLRKSRSRIVRINRRTVELTPEGIQRAIEEEIEIKEK